MSSLERSGHLWPDNWNNEDGVDIAHRMDTKMTAKRLEFGGIKIICDDSIPPGTLYMRPDIADAPYGMGDMDRLVAYLVAHAGKMVNISVRDTESSGKH